VAKELAESKPKGTVARYDWQRLLRSNPILPLFHVPYQTCAALAAKLGPEAVEPVKFVLPLVAFDRKVPSFVSAHHKFGRLSTAAKNSAQPRAVMDLRQLDVAVVAAVVGVLYY
tara:strand:- start:122 stop:463 length:342 start_codon:yes stop_codon:yes gene_type:complete